MEVLANLQTMLTDMLGPFGPVIAMGGAGLLLVLAAIPLMFVGRKDPLD